MNAYEYPHDWKLPLTIATSKTKMEQVAEKWGVELAAIKAVAHVESGGDGFWDNGEPIILFEPHVFWRRLVARGISPNTVLIQHPNLKPVLYRIQGTLPYGKSSMQHKRLALAATYNRDAALEAASWGKYQVLGENWRDLKYNSIQEFINDAYGSDDTQFELFVRFVESKGLVKYLKKLDFRSFAKYYNGKNFEKFKYDTKMLSAYKLFKNQ